MEKEGAMSGRRLLQRGTAGEVPKAEQVRCLLSELEELIASAELALAAGKHKRQSEHVCTAVCLRLHSLHQMLSPAVLQVPTRGVPTDSESDGEVHGVNRRRRHKPLQSDPRKGIGGKENATACSHWSEIMGEGQRTTAGSLVARLPEIVKRFTDAQRAKACDAADNLMQALDLPLVMQEHKPKKSERGTPAWVKPKLQSPEGLQELVILARETKSCSYDDVVTQIWQQNKRSELQLCEEVELVDEILDGDIDAHAETWSILLTCPLSLTRMQVPARSLACKHLECFDLLSHLKNNTAAHRKMWRCPICKRSASWNELVVDSYVEKLLKEAPPDAVELVIHSDASWAVKSEEDTLEKLGFRREFVNLTDSDSGGEEDEAFYTPLQQSPPSDKGLENTSERAEKVGHIKQELSETDYAAHLGDRGSAGLVGGLATQLRRLTQTAATPDSAPGRENASQAAEDCDNEKAEETPVQRAARGISLREIRALGSVKAADFTEASWLRPTEPKDYAEHKWRVEEPWITETVRKDGILNEKKRKRASKSEDGKSTKKRKQSLEGQKLVSAVLGQQKKSGYVRIGGWGGARIGAKFLANKRRKEPVTGGCANKLAERGGNRERGKLSGQKMETPKRKRDVATSQERNLRRKTAQKSLQEVERGPSKADVRANLRRSKAPNAQQAVCVSTAGSRDKSSKPACAGPSKKSMNGAVVAEVAAVSSKTMVSESKGANATAKQSSPEEQETSELVLPHRQMQQQSAAIPLRAIPLTLQQMEDLLAVEQVLARRIREAERPTCPEHVPDKREKSGKRLRTPSVRLEEPRSAAEQAGFGGLGVGRLLGFGAKLGFGAAGLPLASSQKTATGTLWTLAAQQLKTAAERKEGDEDADKPRKEKVGARVREPSRKDSAQRIADPSKDVPNDATCKAGRGLDERKNMQKQVTPGKGSASKSVGLRDGLIQQSTEAAVQRSSSKQAADVSARKHSAKVPTADITIGVEAEVGSEATGLGIGLSSRAPSASSEAEVTLSSGKVNALKAAGPECRCIEGDTCSEKKASSRMDNPCSRLALGSSGQREKKSEGSKKAEGAASKKAGKKQPKEREVRVSRTKIESTDGNLKDHLIKSTMAKTAAKAKRGMEEIGLTVKKSTVQKITGLTKSGAEEKAVMEDENKVTSSTRPPVCDIDLNLPEASNVEMHRSDAEQGADIRGSGGAYTLLEFSRDARVPDTWTKRFHWSTEADPYDKSQSLVGRKQDLWSRVCDQSTERQFQQFQKSIRSNQREGPSGQADPIERRESSQGGRSARLEATEEKFGSQVPLTRTQKVVLGDLNRLPSNIIDLTVEDSDGNEQKCEKQKKGGEGSRDPARIKGGGESGSPEGAASSGLETPERDGNIDLPGKQTVPLKREDLKGGWSERHPFEEERFLISPKERLGEDCTEAMQESKIDPQDEETKKEKDPEKEKGERKMHPEEEECAEERLMMPSSDLLARALASRVSECLTNHERPDCVKRPNDSSWRAEARKRQRKRARAERAESVNALGALEPPKVAEVLAPLDGVNAPQHNGEAADVDKVLRAADQYLRRVGRAPTKNPSRLVAPTEADESLASLLRTQRAIDYLVSAMQGDARAQQADVLLRRLDLELEHPLALREPAERFFSQAEIGSVGHASNFECLSLRSVDKSMLEEWVKIFEGRIG